MSVIRTIDTDHCVKMLNAQHWRGIWRNDFEGSQFCPAPVATCEYEGTGDRIWQTPGALHGKRGGLYAVGFVGRSTMYRGPYGHLGMSDHEIIVDRPISARMIKPPPPPMTKAELIAEWRSCEAAHTCIPSAKMRKMMTGSK